MIRRINLLFTKIEKNERSRDGGGVEYWEISLGCITCDMPVRQYFSVEQVVGIISGVEGRGLGPEV